MNEKQTADFGSWESPLSASLIFQGRHNTSNPLPWAGGVLFLQTMPKEQNALVLMYKSKAGKSIRVSPEGFSIRSRVHEYGGLSFVAADNQVFYCNFSDQEIYLQCFDASTESFDDPVQLTESVGVDVRYCELVMDKSRRRLICVREDHSLSNGNANAVINSLVAIPLSEALPIAPDGQLILFSDSDFVCNPALSGDGSLIAFATWSHPNMPWDDTQIRVAQFDDEGALENLLEVDAQQASSKVQPSFDSSNNLYFISDQSNYWNIVFVEQECLRLGCVSRPLYSIQADCCGPTWEMGKRNYAVVDGAELFISVVKDCYWQLHRLSLANQQLEIVEQGLGLLEQIRQDKEGNVFYLAAAADDYPSIRRLECEGKQTRTTVCVEEVAPIELSADLVSRAQHIEFVVGKSSKAYGLLYLPKSSQFTAPSTELPPLLVNVHGGPTGTARAALNPMHQFWTSRGFAVLDLNHRGSSGYGRQFRKLLYGQWGVVDIEDIVAGVNYLVDTKQVAGDKIAIRGGSAGGYAVLASLAACDLFSAGTSYYGVSDLELLARDTHKFESRYLDQLIGPYPEAKDVYHDRSPINRLEYIEAPVLILQGEEDKVVPPNQAILVNDSLSAQNPATEFISFSGEGHGFRQPANQIRALEAELSFYRRNLLGLES